MFKLSIIFALGLAPFLLLGVGAGDSNSMAESAKTMTELIGRVKDVAALPEGENVLRQRWRVDLEVIKILSSSENVSIREGQQVTILVHSIVKSFGFDRADVLGRAFRFVYKNPYQEFYTGNIDIFEEP